MQLRRRAMLASLCPPAEAPLSLPTRRDRLIYLTLAPLVLAYTGFHLWRLATRGTLWVHDHGQLVEVSGGFLFWLTLGLYLLLTVAALLVLATAWRR